jgi:small GTP-binding protein
MQVLYPEAKVILLGEFGVGKTSIFRRYSLGTFIDTSGMDWSQYREFTLGLDNYSKKFECITDNNETKTISLRLYDTGGLERIGSIGNSYYKSSEAALLVFARNNVDSFNCLTQHLLEVLSFGETAKLYLVSNKVDINDQEVSDEDVRTFMDQFPIIEDYFQVSCKTNEPSVDEMFCTLAQKIASSNRISRRLDSIKLTHSPSPGPDEGPTYEHQYEHNATDLYGPSSSCSNCI